MKINLKEQLKNKKILIILFIIVILIVMFFIGISYAWYKTALNESINNETQGSSNIKINKPLDIDYGKIEPGWTNKRTFSVTNSGKISSTYSMIWKEMINSFTRNQDLVIDITSTNDGGNISNEVIPKTGRNINIINDITIGSNVTQEYTIIFKYLKQPKIDQSLDSNKNFTGIIDIITLN